MFKPVPTYYDDSGNCIQFFPVDKSRPVPGFSHRCVINGQAVKAWRVTGRPNVDDAEFFFDKYGAALAKVKRTPA